MQSLQSFSSDHGDALSFCNPLPDRAEAMVSCRARRLLLVRQRGALHGLRKRWADAACAEAQPLITPLASRYFAVSCPQHINLCWVLTRLPNCNSGVDLAQVVPGFWRVA